MVQFGHDFKEKYYSLLDKDVTLVNHGSYGTTSTMVMEELKKVCELEENYPDAFYLIKAKERYVAQIKALSDYIGLDSKNLALVPNATMGINTVLRSVPWDFEKDSVLVHTTSYGACSNTVKFLHDYYGLKFDTTNNVYPMEDDDVLKNFEEKLATGKHKLCMFDMISSMPGVMLPYEKLITLCKKYNVLSLIDGAHAIGMVDLKFIDELQPDFLTTNLHKWMSVPKSCAMLYVNPKHHSTIQTNPISWSYIPNDIKEGSDEVADTVMIDKFWYLGTVSYAPMLCVEEAIKFRKEICGGEKVIRNYQVQLRKEAIKLVIEQFGPGAELLENTRGTLNVPGMFNISFPVEEKYVPVVKYLIDNFHEWRKFKADCEGIMVAKDKSFAPFLVHNNKIYVRFSVFIINEASDYTKSAKSIKVRLEEALEEKYQTLYGVGGKLQNLNID
ncbi:similar to Naumovozyma castellii NCAS_0A13310 hypothetical protein [Maudiozyma saulgeensis]|uniref:Aminotransferase class V domain-containing protein n=1 Tax=Maudiozyma saulgeensis TaxID=1789683 RepID=A0A1X7R8S5_9SACH|nr:similar to Naumovozyma castellii NCAS_0A13310 hypothetical protein [Kazachstania saulgeensis]